MIVLYTNHCPKCSIIKTKLDQKKIEYTLVDDETILAEKGLDFMPVLEVDGNIMSSMIDINNYIEGKSI